MSLGSLGQGRDSLRSVSSERESRFSNHKPRLSIQDQISMVMDNRRSAFKRASIGEESSSDEDSNDSDNEWA